MNGLRLVCTLIMEGSFRKSITQHLISATLFYQVSSHKHLDPAVRMRHLGYTNGGTSGSVFPGGPLGAENASTHEWVIGHPFICYERHATRFLHPESRRAHSLFPRPEPELCGSALPPGASTNSASCQTSASCSTAQSWRILVSKHPRTTGYPGVE